MRVTAYLEITMKINEANRPAAAKVYTDYRGRSWSRSPVRSPRIC